MTTSTPASVRPYLSIADGIAVIELLSGVSFLADVDRHSVFPRLQELVAAGRCDAAISERDGATLFHVRGVGPFDSVQEVVMVFDDDTGRLLTIVPTRGAARVLPN